MDNSEMTVDKLTGLKIRPTDNGLKEGDVESPQHNEPLELDEAGLPEFVYAAIDGLEG